jgi:5,5'-dehydrodivanillate O-demethylase oxygenase subunit
MITKEENERWTRVGRGTPAGEMLRRYWWPIAFSDEINGPRPKKVRLLDEEFVLFRDGDGRLGMLEAQCAHRRAPMQYGRVEHGGVRCCYHGWLWSREGRCLETPCEEPGSPLKDRVSMQSFDVQDAAGLVFAYIGPRPTPLLPNYDLLAHDSGTRYLWGFTDHCNWLQAAENAADPTHLGWLHAGVYPMYARQRLQVTYVEQPYGIDFVSTVPGLPADKCSSIIFPSHNRFASARTEQQETAGARQNMVFRTPEDDFTTHLFFITLYPSDDGKLVQKTQSPPEQKDKGPWIPNKRGVYPPGDENWWGVTSADQDRMVLEGQGAIYDRSRENLGASDRGVAMYRRMLCDSLDAVAEGRDPVGVIRDPAQNPVIEFGTRLHAIKPALQVLA